jgi:hypothetical protein
MTPAARYALGRAIERGGMAHNQGGEEPIKDRTVAALERKRLVAARWSGIGRWWQWFKVTAAGRASYERATK